MPGKRATLRPEPSLALSQLEREGQPYMEFLRPMVTAVCDLGRSAVGDPIKTNALSVFPVNEFGRTCPKFFAVINSSRRGLHQDKHIGPLGFSVAVAFRNPQSKLGIDWKNDRFDYHKTDGTEWYRYEPKDVSGATLSAVLAVAGQARDSMLH